MQVLIGAAVLGVSLFAFWHALPQDGQVRAYLRNDQVQSYYAVVLVGGIVGGLLLCAVGVTSLFS